MNGRAPEGCAPVCRTRPAAVDLHSTRVYRRLPMTQRILHGGLITRLVVIPALLIAGCGGCGKAPEDGLSRVHRTGILRVGTDAATAQNFALTTNYAGNLPAAYKQGSASEAIIQNLNPGTTYYFSLKTRDAVGNWSLASTNTPSAQPTVDTIAPFFGGANQAIKADSSGTVYLSWTAAEDHTMPITYKIWQKTEAAGALNMSVDSPLLTGIKGHNIVLSGLTNDTIYNFGVRACDANNNCDANTQTVSATPTAEPPVTKNNYSYRTNGSTTLVQNGAAGTAVTAQALPKVFAPAANNTYSVNYFADTFAIYINASSSGSSVVRATLGYSTTGADFNTLNLYKEITVAKRASRIYQFKLSDTTGKTISSGQRLAVQVSLPRPFAGRLIRPVAVSVDVPIAPYRSRRDG